MPDNQPSLPPLTRAHHFIARQFTREAIYLQTPGQRPTWRKTPLTRINIELALGDGRTAHVRDKSFSVRLYNIYNMPGFSPEASLQADPIDPAKPILSAVANIVTAKLAAAFIGSIEIENNRSVLNDLERGRSRGEDEYLDPVPYHIIMNRALANLKIIGFKQPKLDAFRDRLIPEKSEFFRTDPQSQPGPKP